RIPRFGSGRRWERLSIFWPPRIVALTRISSGANSARNCRQAPQGTIGSLVSATTAIATNSRSPAATALAIAIRSAQIVRPYEIFSTLLQTKTAPDLHLTVAPTAHPVYCD